MISDMKLRHEARQISVFWPYLNSSASSLLIDTVYCMQITHKKNYTPLFYLIYSQLSWQIESYTFVWIYYYETMLLGLAYLVFLPRPGSKASCLSRSAITGCSWWELVYSSKAVGSKMIHRRCKSLPNPHPSIAAMLLMSAFSPQQSSGEEVPTTFKLTQTSLLSNWNWNRCIVIKDLFKWMSSFKCRV